MKYSYKTPQELESERPMLSEGEADFEIVKAEDAISKSSGNEMIKLSVKVWDSEGQTAIIFDYLVSTVPFKIKQVCESVGRPEWYAANYDLNPGDLIGQSGKCVLKNEKNQDPQYPDRLKIASYLKGSASEAATINKPVSTANTEPPQSSSDFDDDIPW